MHNVSIRIGFNLVVEEISDGGMPDSDESASGLNGFRAAVLGVFKNGSTQALVIRKSFLDLAEGTDLNFRIVGCTLVHDG